MRKKMRGVIESATIFLLYTVLTSAMLVIPIVLNNQKDDEATQQAKTAETVVPEPENGLPQGETPQAQHR